MKYIFIANGRPDKSEACQKLSDELKEAGHKSDCSLYITKSPGDATKYVKEHCLAHQMEQICYVACGGDGTINEVVSGMVGQPDKYLAVIAMGTGNDFVKYYPGKRFDSVSGVLKGTSRTIDIMRINKDKYSINVCNIGFDASVCDIANKLSYKGIKDAYRKAVAMALLSSRFNRIRIYADGKLLSRRRMLLCTMANNTHIGGEFHCAPRADNQDGLIEVCLVRSITLLKFLLLIPLYAKGQHLDSPKTAGIITYRRARHIDIHCNDTNRLCIDGEIIYGKDFSIDIIPNTINLIIPE